MGHLFLKGHETQQNILKTDYFCSALLIMPFKKNSEPLQSRSNTEKTNSQILFILLNTSSFIILIFQFNFEHFETFSFTFLFSIDCPKITFLRTYIFRNFFLITFIITLLVVSNCVTSIIFYYFNQLYCTYSMYAYSTFILKWTGFTYNIMVFS